MSTDEILQHVTATDFKKDEGSYLELYTLFIEITNDYGSIETAKQAGGKDSEFIMHLENCEVLFADWFARNFEAVEQVLDPQMSPPPKVKNTIVSPHPVNAVPEFVPINPAHIPVISIIRKVYRHESMAGITSIENKQKRAVKSLCEINNINISESTIRTLILELINHDYANQ